MTRSIFGVMASPSGCRSNGPRRVTFVRTSSTMASVTGTRRTLSPFVPWSSPRTTLRSIVATRRVVSTFVSRMPIISPRRRPRSPPSTRVRGLVPALREILERGYRPTLNVSWAPEQRRWRLTVRGLDDNDRVRDEIVMEIDAGMDAGPDLGTLVLVHLAVVTFRETLVREVFPPDHEAGGSTCPPS